MELRFLLISFVVVIICVCQSFGGVARKNAVGDLEQRLIPKHQKFNSTINGTSKSRNKKKTTKHLAYLMNFRTGSDKGSNKRIKNVESKTYIINLDDDKRVAKLRENKMVADKLVQQLLKEGLVYRTKPLMQEGTQKHKRSSKAIRHVPRFFDELKSDQKFNHPGSRGGDHDIVLENSENESDEMVVIERYEENSKEKIPAGGAKKNCYNNVYKNVLGAFQEALKQQINSYKNCMCNKGKKHSKSDHHKHPEVNGELEGVAANAHEIDDIHPNQQDSDHSHSHKKQHKHHHRHNSQSKSGSSNLVPVTITSTVTTTTEEPTTTEMPTNINHNVVPEVMHDPDDDDYICFHRQSAILLSEFLRNLQNNATRPHDNIPAPSFRNDRQFVDRNLNNFNSLEFDKSEDVEKFEIPVLTTTAKPKTPEVMNDDEQNKLMALLELLKVLQEDSDQPEIYQQVLTTMATTTTTVRTPQKVMKTKNVVNEIPKSSGEFVGSENSVSQEDSGQIEKLEAQVRNFLFPNGNKTFRKSASSSLPKSQRKSSSNPRKVRHNENSSDEFVGEPEITINQSTRSQKYSTKYQPQHRTFSNGQTASDPRKKLSLAVQIPQSSTGIVRKIKYELE